MSHHRSAQPDPDGDAPSSQAQGSAAQIEHSTPDIEQDAVDRVAVSVRQDPPDKPPEHGGRDGLDPTRYGDWEKKGRCIDF